MRMMRFFASFIIFTLLLSPVLADDEPTYEQTLSFIQSKSETKDASDYAYTLQKFIEHDHCKFEVKNIRHLTKAQEYGRVGKIYDESVFFNAQDIDPTRIKQNGYLALYTRADELKVDSKFVYYPAYHASFKLCKSWDDHTYTGDICYKRSNDSQINVHIYTYNPDVNIPKLARAFKRLIELCGGKGELF